jgi:hypothetical protein
MKDCPIEFECDSCNLRGTLECPCEYNTENEDNLCHDCSYEENSQEMKPCNSCLQWIDGYLTATNYCNKHLNT